MKVTQENRETVKSFMKILVDLKLSEEAVKMITTMLQNERQMDELVAFIKKNINATEAEILDKAEEISNIR